MTGIRDAARRWAARATGEAVIVFVQFVTAARALWAGSAPEPRQRVYFANHTSNGDFVLIWTVLPRMLRRGTRPVAAADYWLRSPLRRFIGREVFDAVLIERDPARRSEDPVAQMTAALDGGASLILFPEGGRNQTEAPLLPFKSGLYHLGRARPEVDLVPVHVRNLNRVMPKGEVVPLPLICTVTFGAAMHVGAGESKEDFLSRAAGAVLALAAGEAARMGGGGT